MILIVDMNSKENPFGFYEFVLPIVSIAEELEKCDVKHYLEVNEKSLNSYDKIVLSGSALKDTVTLDQTARFTWLKDCGKTSFRHMRWDANHRLSFRRTHGEVP